MFIIWLTQIHCLSNITLYNSVCIKCTTRFSPPLAWKCIFMCYLTVHTISRQIHGVWWSTCLCFNIFWHARVPNVSRKNKHRILHQNNIQLYPIYLIVQKVTSVMFRVKLSLYMVNVYMHSLKPGKTLKGVVHIRTNDLVEQQAPLKCL